MAIVDTTTQEFDWTSYGVTETRDNITYFDFISDYAHNSFTDAGGSGQYSNAYQNWRAINRVLAPQINRYGAAIVGTIAKDSNGESWLSPAITGSFQSDGVYAPPPPLASTWTSYDTTSVQYNRRVYTDTDWGYVNNNYDLQKERNFNTCTTVTYQSRDPNGVPVGTFIPLMMLRPNTAEHVEGAFPFPGTNVTHFNQLDSIDDAYDTFAASHNLDPEEQSVYHRMVPSLGTAKMADTILGNKYVGRGNDQSPYCDYDPWYDSPSPSTATPKSKLGGNRLVLPGQADVQRDYACYAGMAERMLWYAHDGNGNGMLVVTCNAWTQENTCKNATAEIGHYNAYLEQTRGVRDGASVETYFSQGGNNSGQYLWKFPRRFTDLEEYGTSSLIHTIASQSESAGTRWLVDPIDPSKNLMTQALPFGRTNSTAFEDLLGSFAEPAHINGMQHNNFGLDAGVHQGYVYRSPHILMFPTKMGTADDAALKTPQNFYLWWGYNQNAGQSGSGGGSGTMGTQDIKFGEMVRTNCRVFNQPFIDGSHGIDGGNWYTNQYSENSTMPSWYGGLNSTNSGTNWNNAYWASGRSKWAWHQSMFPHFVASHTGNVGINRVTYGRQEPAPDMRFVAGQNELGDEPRYVQFAGVSTSYNAITAPEYSIAAGTLINNNNAWTNPEYLMDTESGTETTCTATGFENHLAVKLSGTPEGAAVDPSEPVKELILNVGGIRKLVLGPQILKIGVYSDNGGVLGDLIAGPLELYADGNDAAIASRQVVFDQDAMATSPTYSTIQNAWVAFWTESP